MFLLFCDFHKHESDKNKKCLTVGNFGILFVFIVEVVASYVVHLQPKLAYVEALNIY